jgi:ABC-type sulfate transport system permease component
MIRLRTILGAVPMVLLLFLPLVLSIILVLPGLTDIASFTAAFEHPQFGGALKLTLWTVSPAPPWPSVLLSSL